MTACIGLPDRANADFMTMLRRVPADANVLVLIDAQGIAASPLAARERWSEKRESDYAARPLTFPPKAERIVRAAQFDVDTHETKWQVAILEANSIPTLDTIAKKVGGYLDTIANSKAVWSPRGWYCFKVDDHAVGMMFPANRQYLSRWMKAAPGRLSPYLQKAADARNAKSQILVAVDLGDVVKPQQLQERLKEMESLKGQSGVADIAAVVSSLEGAVFEVAIHEKAFGNLRIDFSTTPAAIREIAKPMILEALSDAGLYVDDFEAWPAVVDNNSVRMSGELSRSALMRLSSLLELPSPPLDDSGRDADTADAGDPKAYASQAYFKSIQTLLNDLLSTKKEAKSLGHMAMFLEQYSRRIDRLPLVNVDPELQDYGLHVVKTLREAAAAYKGAGVKSGARRAQVWGTNYDYYGNQIAGSNPEVNSQRQAIAAEERATGVLTGVSLREDLANETSQIRRKMTDRYKVEF